MSRSLCRSLLLLTGVAAACGKAAPAPTAGATPSADAALRARAPEATPPPALRAPVPDKKVLPNGLVVLVVENHRLPLVAARVVLRAGSATDPKELPGLTGFLAQALEHGTASRSAQQIADEVETFGGSLTVGADEDSIVATASSMTENFDAVFDVLADVLQHPALAAEELERVRQERLAELAALADDPSRTAQRAYARALFGEHPYGHTVLGSAAALQKIDRAALQRHFDAVVGPAAAAVIIVGDLTAAQAFGAVRKRFESWRPAKTTVSAPPAAPLGKPILWLVDKPGAPQSELRVGHVGLERSHPDYFPMVLANAILGGLFSSRINMNLRENKGWTYGARSSVDFRRSKGPFVVGTAVRTDATAPAVSEIIKEISALRDADVTAQELDAAKASYTLSLPGMFETLGAIADSLGRLFLFDLPLDYFQTLPEKLAAVRIADVRRVAQEHLKPEAVNVVVVGDRQQVEASLAGLGRGAVEVRKVEGL